MAESETDSMALRICVVFFISGFCFLQQYWLRSSHPHIKQKIWPRIPRSKNGSFRGRTADVSDISLTWAAWPEQLWPHDDHRASFEAGRCGPLMVWAWVGGHPHAGVTELALLAMEPIPQDEDFCSHGWWENSRDKQCSRHQGPGETQSLYLWKAELWVTQRFQLCHLFKVDAFHEHLFEYRLYLVTCISTFIYLNSKHTWLHYTAFHLGWWHLSNPSLDLANK